jgi:hypothetical protein
MTKRGRVLRDTNAGPGLVTVEGKQYSFTLEDMWVSEIPPRPGMVVEVTFDGSGAPRSVAAVPENQLAKEQAQHAFEGARRHGVALTGSLRSRFGIPVVIAEAVMLISFFLLPNMRMGGGYMDHPINGWDALGLDPATTAINNHGILSLLALALFAPLAVPFVQKAWSRWLYAAPFAFALIAFASVYYEIQNTGRAASRAVTDVFGANALPRGFGNPMAGMYSPAIGAFLVLLCAVYLLVRALRSPAVLSAS